MFKVQINRPDGVSKEFPLEIFKSSIYVGGAWEPCASFFVPEEADAFAGYEGTGESIVYAYLEGSVTDGDFYIDDDQQVSWKLLLRGKPCTHDEFSNAAFNKLIGVTA